MAQQYRPLPLDIFTEKQRPYIAQLNRDLRDVFGLEGVLTNPGPVNRSDRTIVRRIDALVNVDNIVPSITNIINGSSSAIGVPSLTFSTGNAIGTTNTVVSINSTVKFPQAIMALGTVNTLTITDDATNEALLTQSAAFTVSAISLKPSGSAVLKIDATAVRRSSSDFAALTNGFGLIIVDGTPHYWRLSMSTDGIPFCHDTGASPP